jgi:hypothetical protein
MMNEIPKRFSDNIKLHLIRNIWNETDSTTALIMGISGPPGEGKSYQCREVLTALNYKYIEMSTNDFSSSLEGEAAKNLCAKYVEASVLSQITQHPYAIICDDIDVAIGYWSDLTQYTVNLQHLSGVLMHFCDNPKCIQVERSKFRGKSDLLKFLGNPDTQEFEAKTNRVPIFFTGNDFTKLYAPLLRAGRMTVFNWIPSPDEKINVVAGIFQPYLNRSEIQELVTHCIKLAEKIGVNNLPISFYTSLKNRVLDDFILKTIEQDGWDHAYKKFQQRGVSALSHKPSYSDCIDKTEESIKLLVNQSHLAR